MTTVLVGCGSSGQAGGDGFGSFSSRSLRESAALLSAEFQTAVYAHEPGGDTVFILADQPLDELLSGGVDRGQIMVIDLLWPPRAGTTPIAPDATNASIRHLVVIDGEIGTYAGAGFAMPSGTIGDPSVSLDLWDGTVRLIGATDGFSDVLSPARVQGSLTATEDAGAIQRLSSWIRSASPPAIGS